MTAVEAVARAICRSQCTCTADDKCDDYDGWPTRAARAALAAIRVPTPAMLQALWDKFPITTMPDREAIAEAWAAAIDAAMEEPTPPRS